LHLGGRQSRGGHRRERRERRHRSVEPACAGDPRDPVPPAPPGPCHSGARPRPETPKPNSGIFSATGSYREGAIGSITGSELVPKSLKAQGMDTLFYLMGGPMLETESACIKLGVRAIDSRHEQAASMMAHAYSRLTRRPGVCMASSGPGTINMATGVANAFIDAAPLVAVGGTSPRVFFGMDAFQEVDQLSLYKPMTKWAARTPPRCHAHSRRGGHRIPAGHVRPPRSRLPRPSGRRSGRGRR